MLERHERTARFSATATRVAVAMVLLIALPANANPIPYDIEIQTGSGKMDGTVTQNQDATSWDLKLEDTDEDDGACVYAKLVVDRDTPPDNAFRSKNACSGEPVDFTGEDPHENDGFTLEFCSDKSNKCIRIPAALIPSPAR